MKKLLLFLALALSGLAMAATDTPTNTPTNTPTSTPTPNAVFSSAMSRIYISPKDCWQDDGITGGGTSVVAGPTWYLSQYLSQTAATLGTNSAKVRFDFVLPADYTPRTPLKVWALAHHSITNTAVPVIVDWAVMDANAPTGNATTVYPGVTTLTTITAQTVDPLRNFIVSTVLLPNPRSLTITANLAKLVPRAKVSATLVSSAPAGVLRVFQFIVGYNKNNYLNP